MPEQDKDLVDTTQKESPGRKVARLKPSGQVVVVHHTMPPKGPAEKEIHPRRPLPPVPPSPARQMEHGKKGTDS